MNLKLIVSRFIFISVFYISSNSYGKGKSETLSPEMGLLGAPLWISPDYRKHVDAVMENLAAGAHVNILVLGPKNVFLIDLTQMDEKGPWRIDLTQSDFGSNPKKASLVSKGTINRTTALKIWGLWCRVLKKTSYSQSLIPGRGEAEYHFAATQEKRFYAGFTRGLIADQDSPDIKKMIEITLLLHSMMMEKENAQAEAIKELEEVTRKFEIPKPPELEIDLLEK